MTIYEFPRPNDETETVRDANGATWTRDGHPNRRASFWYGPDGRILTWAQVLVEYGPLTDTTKQYADGYLCVCCTMLMANGEDCEHCDHSEHPLMALLADEDVSLNCEEDCESGHFSWSSCDGCGSPLGGDRHRVAIWES